MPKQKITFDDLLDADSETLTHFLASLSHMYNLALDETSLDQLHPARQIEVDWISYLTSRLYDQIRPSSVAWFNVYDLVPFFMDPPPDEAPPIRPMKEYEDGEADAPKLLLVPITAPTGGHYSTVVVAMEDGTFVSAHAMDSYIDSGGYMNDSVVDTLLDALGVAGTFGDVDPSPDVARISGFVVQSAKSQNCGFFVTLVRQLAFEVAAQEGKHASASTLVDSLLDNLWLIDRKRGRSLRSALQHDLARMFSSYLSQRKRRRAHNPDQKAQDAKGGGVEGGGVGGEGSVDPFAEFRFSPPPPRFDLLLS